MIDIAILAIIAVPALLFIVLRSNAAVGVLSLFAGSVIAQTASGDTSRLFETVIPSAMTAEFKLIPLVLLLLPVVVSFLFLSKSVKASHLLLQLLPAACIGLVGLLLAVPYLSANAVSQLGSSQLWATLQNLNVAIIGGAVFVSLVSLWLQRPKQAAEHDKHHH